jgi:hypothetical protein
LLSLVVRKRQSHKAWKNNQMQICSSNNLPKKSVER